MITRSSSCLLLLLVLVHVDNGEGKMSEMEFNALLHRFRQGGRQLPDSQFHLLYEQINTMFWNSPDSLGKGASGLENTTYSVILYEIAPFVSINDVEAVQGDPGNVNQTRTPRNGGLSGITIEFLSLVEYHTGAIFQYYYPCLKSDLQLNGICNAELVRMPNESLALLDSGLSEEVSQYVGGGRYLCGPRYQCFSAGAHKISEGLLIRYFLTQPIMMTGYRLVTLAVPDSPTIFSWASPFTYGVWLVIAVEIIVCGLAIFIVEFNADNDSLATNNLMRMWDTIYFSITIVLGVSDKQPITHGGRTVVLAQLFLALILQAVFTGNLNNILLSQPFKTNVETFQDYTNPLAPNFNPRNTICYPVTDLIAKNYLDLEAGLHQEITVNIVTAPNLEDCLQMVYTGEVTAAFSDAPVLDAALSADFLQTGRCGLNGGYCSEWQMARKSCHCYIPEPSCNASALGQACPEELDPTCNLTFTPQDSSLILVGEIFNPVGYALVFPRTHTFLHHLSFNQVLLYVQEQGDVQRIVDSILAPPPCASDVGVVPVVGVLNVVGLFICVVALTALGFAIGYMEVIVRILKKCGCDQVAGMLRRACCVCFQQPHHPEPEPPQPKKKKLPFTNRAPPVLPLNFDAIPVQACLVEIQDRLQQVEQTLEAASAKAGAAMEIYERLPK